MEVINILTVDEALEKGRGKDKKKRVARGKATIGNQVLRSWQKFQKEKKAGKYEMSDAAREFHRKRMAESERFIMKGMGLGPREKSGLRAAKTDKKKEVLKDLILEEPFEKAGKK